ncbi:hypothetical protein KFE98_09875 [bacterium SCSIO 12741]|nr:hypothetical protein KFE98_09875 [bacterium SCSIO 12741]
MILAYNKFLTALGVCCLFGSSAMAQLSTQQINGTPVDDRLNTITTAVPFLMIAPESRGEPSVMLV